MARPVTGPAWRQGGKAEMRRPWVNLVGNQLVWLCAVAGAGRGWQWPALLSAALYIGSQLSSSPHVRLDLRLILLALACAWLVDASAAASGSVRYAAAALAGRHRRGSWRCGRRSR